MRSRGRPTCWRSTPPSRRRAPARRAAASAWSRARSRTWPSRPARPTSRSTNSVRELAGEIGNLIADSGAASRHAKEAGSGADQIQGVVAHVHDGFSAVDREVNAIARTTAANLEHCDTRADRAGRPGRRGRTLVGKSAAGRPARRRAAEAERDPDRVHRRERRRDAGHAADPRGDGDRAADRATRSRMRSRAARSRSSNSSTRNTARSPAPIRSST